MRVVGLLRKGRLGVSDLPCAPPEIRILALPSIIVAFFGEVDCQYKKGDGVGREVPPNVLRLYGHSHSQHQALRQAWLLDGSGSRGITLSVQDVAGTTKADLTAGKKDRCDDLRSVHDCLDALVHPTWP